MRSSTTPLTRAAAFAISFRSPGNGRLKSSMTLPSNASSASRTLSDEIVGGTGRIILRARAALQHAPDRQLVEVRHRLSGVWVPAHFDRCDGSRAQSSE